MKPPALQTPPIEYSRGYLDGLLRVLTQYFNSVFAEVDYKSNRSTPAKVTQNTQMGDDEHSFVADVSGLTMTLPPANSARLGRDWTVNLGTMGWVDITVSVDNTLLLPTTDDTIRLTVKGASVTLRCMSGSTWGIV